MAKHLSKSREIFERVLSAYRELNDDLQGDMISAINSTADEVRKISERLKKFTSKGMP